MARRLVPDELWAVVQPLLPRHKAKPGKRGRPPVDDRACLTGIVFVLQSGIPWEMLPQEMGCGSGMTCWRRLRFWQRRGVWKKLLHALLQRIGQEQGIDPGGPGGVVQLFETQTVSETQLSHRNLLNHRKLLGIGPIPRISYRLHRIIATEQSVFLCIKIV